MFKFELNDNVTISASGERGVVKGRAEYATGAENCYYVIYKAGDGTAKKVWWEESDLELV